MMLRCGRGWGGQVGRGFQRPPQSLDASPTANFLLLLNLAVVFEYVLYTFFLLTDRVVGKRLFKP